MVLSLDRSTHQKMGRRHHQSLAIHNNFSPSVSYSFSSSSFWWGTRWKKKQIDSPSSTIACDGTKNLTHMPSGTSVANYLAQRMSQTSGLSETH